MIIRKINIKKGEKNMSIIQWKKRNDLKLERMW